MSSMNLFLRGIAVPVQGIFLVLTSFRLMLLAFLPFWIAVFTSIYLLMTFWSRSQDFLPYAVQWVPGFSRFVEQLKIGEFSLVTALFQGVFWVFLLLFVFYFSYILLCLIGAPFYSLMTDQILARRGVRLKNSNHFFHWLYTTARMLIVSLLKLMVFMLLTAVLFVVSFWSFGLMIVPLMVCLMISYDCIDFSLECMNYTLRERWLFFKTHFALFAGLSVSILLLSFVPGLFTLCLPFFIAGGADVFSRLSPKGNP